MKLQFLGQTYDAATVTLNTMKTRITGQFRGSRYLMSYPVPAQSKAHGQRKYRGVTY